MSGNIKGITIEFRGNATPLQKAIRQVDSELKKTDAELKKVNTALKFNPTSVELWKQKQDLLKNKISETETKLKSLKQAQKQMDASGVDKNSEEYRKLQREIIETESKLKTFKGQLRQIGNVNLKAAAAQIDQMGQSLKSAGEKMQGLSLAAAGVVTALGGIAYNAGQNADDLNTMSKVYHISTQELQMYSAAAKLVDVDVETIAKSHVKLTKAMSESEDETGAQAEAFKTLGISVTDADGNLRDADTVWQETIKALGEVSNETERDALAMTLMGKSAADLNPLIEDGGEAYQNLAETMEKYGLEFLDQNTLDKANEFNDELDTMKAIGTVALQTVGSELASALAPALEKVVEWVGKLANWLSNLDPKVLTVIATVAAVVAGLAPLLMILGMVASGISAVIGVLGLLAGPVGIVIAVIAALIAIGVLLYKNWDTIKAKAIALKDKVVTIFNNIKNSITTAITNLKTKIATTFDNIKTKITTTWDNIKTKVQTTVGNMVTSVQEKIQAFKDKVKAVFDKIKESITKPIEKAKELVTSAIEKIKSIFPLKLGKIFDGIKLPHFKISGGKIPWGIGGAGEKPTVSIEWYKTGGIFSDPSIIGVGEAGPEAVVPLDKFWDKLDKMQMGQSIVININGSNKDPREIAEEVKRVLIRETNQRRLAWQ